MMIGTLAFVGQDVSYVTARKGLSPFPSGLYFM